MDLCRTRSTPRMGIPFSLPVSVVYPSPRGIMCSVRIDPEILVSSMSSMKWSIGDVSDLTVLVPVPFATSSFNLFHGRNVLWGMGKATGRSVRGTDT